MVHEEGIGEDIRHPAGQGIPRGIFRHEERFVARRRLHGGTRGRHTGWTLENGRRHIVLRGDSGQSAQPILMVERMDILARTFVFLIGGNAIEMRDFPVQRGHRLVRRKGQADTLPGIVVVVGITQRFAHIPGTIRHREGNRHREVVVDAGLAFAVLVVGRPLNEVEEWCGVALPFENDVVSFDNRLPRGLIVGKCLFHNVVGLRIGLRVVLSRVNKKILRDTGIRLHHEIAEACGVVVDWRIEDAATARSCRRREVIVTGEVDGRCGRVMNVGAHGGGAFSGKDSSKVDRSAAYAARYIAKNMVAAGVADEMLVQVSYAIGVAEPVSIYVNTYGRSHVNMTDGEIAKKIAEMFDLRPKAIERQLKLRQPMFQETAAYGHMGRKNEIVEKTFTSRYHEAKTVKVELFTWEKLDKVDEIKKVFGL